MVEELDSEGQPTLNARPLRQSAQGRTGLQTLVPSCPAGHSNRWVNGSLPVLKGGSKTWRLPFSNRPTLDNRQTNGLSLCQQTLAPRRGSSHRGLLSTRRGQRPALRPTGHLGRPVIWPTRPSSIFEHLCAKDVPTEPMAARTLVRHLHLRHPRHTFAQMQDQTHLLQQPGTLMHCLRPRIRRILRCPRTTIVCIACHRLGPATWRQRAHFRRHPSSNRLKERV